MNDILAMEDSLRLAVFLGVLAIMAVWEVAAPKRRREIPRLIRWSNNLALVVADTLALRLVFPILAVGTALWADEKGWGLLNMVGIAEWLAVLIAFVLLDMVIYFQHVIFHKVPVLWRLHRMHHADLEIDVTTGLRFHPFEIIASMAIKIAVVVLLGAPAVAVLLFEVVLNGSALFNHSNVRLPAMADRILRLVIVTPDMHRVHHSIHRDETDSNYGFNLVWWDRLFGTYTDQPRDGHDGMKIGIELFRNRRELWLDKLLLQPFRNDRAKEKANE